MRMFACCLYVGMLSVFPIAACDAGVPIPDCVMDFSVLYNLLVFVW